VRGPAHRRGRRYYDDWLVRGRQGPVLPGVRARLDRRRARVRVGLSAAAVLAVLGAVGGVTTALSTSDSSDTPSAARGTPVHVPAGWRMESSLGVEIAVPGDWIVNDWGCNQTPAPTVVRYQGAVTACLTPEPASKDIAVIDNQPDMSAGAAPRSLDGQTVQRARSRLPDGRYAGWFWVESRSVAVTVRTHSEATTRTVLDSARLVDVDSRGYTVAGPVEPHPADTATFVLADPTSVSGCSYAVRQGPDHRLKASVELTGASARRLAAAMNWPGRYGKAPGR
jgi:hypothetical protein